MSFRTVVITNQAKITTKNNYLVLYKENTVKNIHLSEIDTIIIDSTMVSISTNLLNEISQNKIKIIFCDEKHNPYGELTSYYGSCNNSQKILQQIVWTKDIKKRIWQIIIKQKIYNQMLLLKKSKKDGVELLKEYFNSVLIDDKTNREGHAAKVYFYSLFGNKFTRNANNSINAALNYGYSIILSTFNKEIVSNGYLTQLGIKHKNIFNSYNLSCDLMEPFRIIIDEFVYRNKSKEFNREYKMELVNLLNQRYHYAGKKYYLSDIIKLYTKNILDAINDKNTSNIKEFIIYERENYANVTIF